MISEIQDSSADSMTAANSLAATLEAKVKAPDTPKSQSLEATTRGPEHGVNYDRQLQRVERDIRSIEARIAQGDQADGDSGPSLPEFLVGLQAEAAEIKQRLGLVEKKSEPLSPRQPKDPYRFAGQPIERIERSLRGLPSWPSARDTVRERYRGSGTGITPDHFLREIAREVRSGRMPFNASALELADAASLQVPASSPASSQKKAPKFDQAYPLPAQSISGYDRSKQTSGNQSMSETSHESYSTEDPRAQDGSSRRDDLRDMLLEGSDDFYGGASGHSETVSGPEDPGGLDGELRQIASHAETGSEAGVIEGATSAAQIEAGQLDRERAITVEFAGRNFTRGDRILYRYDNGQFGEYNVICNTVGEPPGLAVESVSDEFELFEVTAADASRIHSLSGINSSPTAPDEVTPDASSERFGLRPTESDDAERVGTGGMGNEPWSLEDFGRTPESDDLPGDPAPPDNPGSPEDPSGPPEVIDQPEGIEIPAHLLDGIPRVPTMAEVTAEAESMRDGLDAQIRIVAQAKENREKLWNIKREKRVETLQQEQSKLDTLHNEYLGAWAYRLAQLDRLPSDIDQTKAGFQSEINICEEEIARVEASDRPDEVKAIQIRRLQGNIAQHRAAMAECDIRKEEARISTESMRVQVSIAMMQDLAIVRTRIEEAQSELKEGKLSQKFKNLWRKYPKTRMAIGVGLGVAGFALAGPVGTAAGLAAVGMRGVGGYMAGEGATNTLHGWRADRADRRATDQSYNNLDSTGQARLDSGVEIVQGQVADGPIAERYRADVENFMRRHPMASDQIMAVLQGRPEASAEVASILLQDQQERVANDAKSNRQAKVIGAATGTAAVIIGQLMRHEHGGGHNPRPPAEPPKPPTGSAADYNPSYDRWAGMASRNPNDMVQNWEAMQAASPAAKAALAEGARMGAAQFDQVYSAASQGMSVDQLHTLNTIIGAGARTIGNDKVAENMASIANQVRNGVGMNRIMQLYNIPNSVA